MSNWPFALINEFLGQQPNASEHGFQIDHILEFSHWFMAFLFVGWSVFLIYVLIRFRKGRHPVADHEGVKSGISTHLEFAVVLIDAVLLIGFAIPIWAKFVDNFPDSKDAIVIHAVGQQFNWNFHMPGPDGVFGKRDVNLVTTSNPLGLDPNNPDGKDDLVFVSELHVPVDRNIIVETSSKDVIHNFALPNMRAAQDAIPGSIIPMTFRPIKTGTYEIVCGQLCGLGHYGMKGSLVVDTQADYEAWLKERAELAGQTNAPAAGERPPNEPGPDQNRGSIPEPGAARVGNPSGTPNPEPSKPPQ
ncbi:MAG: cytochrome c oxidase subunit II [Verrucomicrobia bacterium]|nr:cytochrome c oxidase subunit II [Verrucomicrobiota bacterium]